MDKKRYPRQEALMVARDLCALLKPVTERLIVAGSLRRRRLEVGDIEILFIPKIRKIPVTLFGEQVTVSEADSAIETLRCSGILSKRAGKTGVFAWGPQNKLAVHVATGIPVDLFATTEANWWVSVVIRTGGKVTNLRLTTGAQKLGRKLHAYGSGVTMENGTLVTAQSEEEVFRLCGVPYLPPERRQ